MKSYRTNRGPFATRPFYKTADIEAICTDELLAVELFPKSPEPIRIERFIEKRFGITHDYEGLPEGTLGYSLFGPGGVERIVIASVLGEDPSKQADRRVRTTLAHEAGHVLLQGHLFVLGEQARSLFDDFLNMDNPRILCRDLPGISSKAPRRYDGRWWEFQANSAIGPLLLPRPLVQKAIEPLLETRGLLGTKILPAIKRTLATESLAEIFDVNPVVAKIRLGEVFPESDETQLTL
jgi:hypothetical protein